jgi:hypothetical protein
LVTMKSTIFCVVTPCSPVKSTDFRGTYRLHLQSLKVRQSRALVACLLLVSRLAYSSILKMETIRSSETSMYSY